MENLVFFVIILSIAVLYYFFDKSLSESPRAKNLERDLRVFKMCLDKRMRDLERKKENE